ncbi:aminodeoxychorismate lyase [Sansalvadorimonas sp. 2012CJ34-2]|uniref:Aminodeoxychorismate lyase n=1 Tax=Parendozoicomonas callyspongiae TaxID=2942213 RepID=A0ABT0PBK1_9GAMM|nr:aminodeoxychorismate lyase [Sansalvadorimonas sp. 2012CJ34-2]MCL6268759.1 aminodeoxychorismate lyase [Sansalvadorimonas sp. 2012CJ34-2]
MSEVVTGHIQPDCWVDGSPADNVTVSDRGLQYGDGVFETIRIVAGAVTLEALHYRRLMHSCDRLQIPLCSELLSQQVARFLAGRGDGILKVMVTRGSGGRGYNPSGACGRIILRWFALPAYDSDWAEKGVTVTLCRTRLGHSPSLAGLKHMNRLEQVLARSEWNSPEIAEGLVFDLTENLIEGTMTNLFLVRDKRLLTPDLSLSGVDGVMRQWLLEESSIKENIEIRPLTLADLHQADEVFLTNSVIGLWPVIRCDKKHWEKGPVTTLLLKEVSALFAMDNCFHSGALDG